MKSVLLLATLTALTACDTRSKTVTEYDPVALASSNYWAGLCILAGITGVTVCIVAWAIAWVITERKR